MFARQAMHAAVCAVAALVMALVLTTHASAFNVAACVLLSALLYVTRPVRLYVHTEAVRPLPPMCFVLLALGTRGDVQPMIAVARELEKRGHLVSVVAADQFKPLIEAHGLAFASCGIASFETQEAGWMEAKSPGEFIATVAQSFMASYADIGKALFHASHGADCIVAGHSGIHMALDVSDATGVAVWTLHLMPEGSSYFTAPFGEKPHWLGFINKWRHVKRVLGAIRAADVHGFTKRQNAFRADVLNLPPVKLERLWQASYYMPSICAYSPMLVPRPPDWPPWHTVTGFLFTPGTEPALDSALDAFVKAGAPPVVVTFGSMSCLDAAGCHLAARCVRACLRVEQRVVVISGWTQPAGAEEGKVFVVPSAPHDLLFPQCRAVVHHGGAGTTARAIVSGVPQVVIPVLRWFDQAGWADAVASVGVGAHVASPWCDEDDVVRALVSVLETKDCARRATGLAAMIAREEGATHAVDVLLAPLPSDSTAAGARMVQRSCLHARARREHGM